MLLRTRVEAASSGEDLYRFGSGLAVSIRGDRRARAHFRAEYSAASAAIASAAPALEATFGRHALGGWPTNGWELRDSHKLARWRALLPPRPEVNPMRVAVDVHGPLGFMLVQSYVIEPLVSLAAVPAGWVLLPCAGIARGEKALLLVGQSRSGKSSLAARALGAGHRILGDDQVVIEATQECLPFPRRLRLYPDIARTAPAAFAALRPSARGALGVLGGVNSLTRGFVAPPLRVSASQLGRDVTAMRLPIGEVVVIRRAPVGALTFEHLDSRELSAEIDDALSSQRAKLFSLAGVRSAFAAVLCQERAFISRSLAAAPARRVLVPASWPAERAVARLARELGLDP